MIAFFLPVIIVAFLLAGVDLPVGTVWTGARWLFLAVGAVVGTLIVLKGRRHHYGLFHAIAAFSVLTALISATVSKYPNVASLKVLSIVSLDAIGDRFPSIFLTASKISGIRYLRLLTSRKILFLNGLYAKY